jgi:SAM-dependent methyltransferase
VEREWIFDYPVTTTLTEARRTFIGEFLKALQDQVVLRSAVDVGCGVGDFSKFLWEQGFRVLALDGREGNVREGQRRYPEVAFRTADAEELPVAEIGAFDLVLCLGLLYHLENPFRTIRYLHSLTDKVLLVEGMCIPSEQATMELLDEKSAEDQGFRNVAFYPSESCLVKMLYCAGFPFVYRLSSLPADYRYVPNVWRKRLRTFLVASKVELRLPTLVLGKESIRYAFEFASWATSLSKLRDFSGPLGGLGFRLVRFLGRPRAEQREIVSWYLRRFWDRLSFNGSK